MGALGPERPLITARQLAIFGPPTARRRVAASDDSAAQGASERLRVQSAQGRCAEPERRGGQSPELYEAGSPPYASARASRSSARAGIPARAHAPGIGRRLNGIRERSRGVVADMGSSLLLPYHVLITLWVKRSRPPHGARSGWQPRGAQKAPGCGGLPPTVYPRVRGSYAVPAVEATERLSCRGGCCQYESWWSRDRGAVCLPNHAAATRTACDLDSGLHSLDAEPRKSEGPRPVHSDTGDIGGSGKVTESAGDPFGSFESLS